MRVPAQFFRRAKQQRLCREALRCVVLWEELWCKAFTADVMMHGHLAVDQEDERADPNCQQTWCSACKLSLAHRVTRGYATIQRFHTPVSA
jgi:hypothetical protein